MVGGVGLLIAMSSHQFMGFGCYMVWVALALRMKASIQASVWLEWAYDECDHQHEIEARSNWRSGKSSSDLSDSFVVPVMGSAFTPRELRDRPIAIDVRNAFCGNSRRHPALRGCRRLQSRLWFTPRGSVFDPESQAAVSALPPPPEGSQGTSHIPSGRQKRGAESGAAGSRTGSHRAATVKPQNAEVPALQALTIRCGLVREDLMTPMGFEPMSLP